MCTISGYAEIMQEPSPDWHLVAKCMMYDIQVFNAEVCDLPSDVEDVKAESIDLDKENEPLHFFSLPQWANSTNSKKKQERTHLTTL